MRVRARVQPPRRSPRAQRARFKPNYADDVSERLSSAESSDADSDAVYNMRGRGGGGERGRRAKNKNKKRKRKWQKRGIVKENDHKYIKMR